MVINWHAVGECVFAIGWLWDSVRQDRRIDALTSRTNSYEITLERYESMNRLAQEYARKAAANEKLHA